MQQWKCSDSSIRHLVRRPTSNQAGNGLKSVQSGSCGYWGPIVIETKETGITFLYENVGNFVNQHMVMVKRSRKVGFVNLNTGEETIACAYDDADPFDVSVPITRVKSNDEWHFIDLAGRKKSPLAWQVSDLKILAHVPQRTWKLGSVLILASNLTSTAPS